MLVTSCPLIVPCSVVQDMELAAITFHILTLVFWKTVVAFNGAPHMTEVFITFSKKSLVLLFFKKTGKTEPNIDI